MTHQETATQDATHFQDKATVTLDPDRPQKVVQQADCCRNSQGRYYLLVHMDKGGYFSYSIDPTNLDSNCRWESTTAEFLYICGSLELTEIEASDQLVYEGWLTVAEDPHFAQRCRFELPEA